MEGEAADVGGARVCGRRAQRDGMEEDKGEGNGARWRADLRTDQVTADVGSEAARRLVRPGSWAGPLLAEGRAIIRSDECRAAA